MDLVPTKRGGLTRAQFEQLAALPLEDEWLENIVNEKTQRAYRGDVREFIAYVGLRGYAELRSVTRPHVIAWRKAMEDRKQKPTTIRRKLSALSSLFDYLCERNAVAGNPVDGVERPKAEGNEGSTPALGDRQARKLLEAPPAKTLKGVRDRAILATLLYHGLRREELCKLRVKDLHSREDVMHFEVHGKGGKLRYIPVAPAAIGLIRQYLSDAGHADDLEGALFRPVRNRHPVEKKKKATTDLNPKLAHDDQGGVPSPAKKTKERTDPLDRHLNPASIYRNVVLKYGRETGISAEVTGLRVHSLRATAATNALSHESDIAKVQEWLGHANVSTTRLYDRRKNKPEDSPTFRVKY